MACIDMNLCEKRKCIYPMIVWTVLGNMGNQLVVFLMGEWERERGSLFTS